MAVPTGYGPGEPLFEGTSPVARSEFVAVCSDDLSRPRDLVRNARANRLVSGPELEILGSVVGLDPVLVVDVFAWPKGAAESLFHDQDVLSDPTPVRLWMVRAKYQHVTRRVGRSRRPLDSGGTPPGRCADPSRCRCLARLAAGLRRARLAALGPLVLPGSAGAVVVATSLTSAGSAVSLPGLGPERMAAAGTRLVLDNRLPTTGLTPRRPRAVGRWLAATTARLRGLGGSVACGASRGPAVTKSRPALAGNLAFHNLGHHMMLSQAGGAL